MKIRNAFLSVLALAAGSLAHAQLIHTPIATPSWVSAIRSNAGDLNLLLAHSGTSAFSLNSVGGSFFTDVSGTVGNGATSVFQVGNNGSFNVSLEIAYLTKESVDANTLGDLGYNTVLNASTPGSILYSNYGAGSNQVYSIFGAPALTNITFTHTDATWGNGVKLQDDASIFHIFEYEAASYTYYIISIDDRGTNAIDHNDGVFVARINTEQVGIQSPVPEPSTYGLIGAAALLGLVGYRRFKASRKAA